MTRFSPGGLDDLTSPPLSTDYLTYVRAIDGTVRKATIGAISGAHSAGSGVFYVQSAPYNAKGDGVTDDTFAVQSAINAAGVVGGIVDLGVGTYLVSASLTNSFPNVKIRGAGKALCIITTNSSAVTPLVIGTLSTATKINYPELEGMTISASGSATMTSGVGATPVYALKIFGVTQCQINDVIAKNGGACFYHQNSDLFNFRQFQMRCGPNSTYAAIWYQGAVDDCTIGQLESVYFNTTANNQVCLRLDEEVTGVANEFNRLSFDACKFGGTTGLTGNIGIQFIAGLRGCTFKNTAFQYNTAATFDFSGFDPGTGSYHNIFSLDGCSIIGTTGTPLVDVFHSPNNSNILIECRSLSIQNATNIINSSANNPSFFFTNSDFSVIANFINCSGGSPHINLAGFARWGTFSGSKVTGAGTPVITQLNGRSGSFVTASKGSSTLSAAATTQAVTFSTQLDVTPTAADILVSFTGSPGSDIGGPPWFSSISATGFTLNVLTGPTNNTNFSYKCSAG